MTGIDKGHLAALCGTYCGACQAYLAKQGGEEHAKMRRQKRFSSASTNTSKAIPDPSWMDGLRCDGCLSDGEIPPHCRSCAMRECVASKQNLGQSVTRCSDCDELPCARIMELIDTGLLHRGEYLPNLAKIREMGVQEWVEYEEERWSCPRCGVPMSWYDAECVACGEPSSERLFPLDAAGEASCPT